ncbi:flagellar biosynthesis protein FlhB [Curvivirga sp.]|uniref:flagellar biosynthesis protein FlhB n=1 Tax=Curvivirga sp. TaxID=2856848 RepID=UPI003B5BBEF7
MADGDDGEKSEEPTARKLQKAREKGTVANSKELTTWLMLLGVALIIGASGPYVAGAIRDKLVVFIAQAHQVPFHSTDLKDFLFDVIGSVLLIILWPILGFLILAFMGNVGQFGLKISLESIKPKFSKLDPIKGAKKYFNAKQLVEFVKNIIKLIVIGSAGVITLIPDLGVLQAMPGIDVAFLPREIYILLLKVMTVVLLILFVIAIGDLVFQRYQHKKQLRMTKQEVKEEFKNVEGDPQVKGRIRQIRMQRAAERMIQAVPQADVVVTNPTHFAVALAYDQDAMDAPKVLAKGQDVIAARIREIAEENEIPMVENPPLARALYATAEVDEYIPEEHYKPVAEVISYVYNLRSRGKTKGRMGKPEQARL